MMQSFDNSYSELRLRGRRQMQNEKINEYISGPVKSVYERAVETRYIVLSKPEKEKLLKNVTNGILMDMLAQLKS